MGISLAQLQSEIATLTQDNVDSIGAAIFGEDYKGKWVARTHNIGNVRSHERKFYKCIVGRTSANTANPGSDTTGWELIGSAADLGSLSDDNINAIGGASFGGNYQGTWEAGIFAVGGVVYHGGFFYECTVARTATDTDDPSVDTASWSITSTTDESGDVSQAVQAAIDGSARIEYGESYKEEWSAGVYAVGDVVYHDGVFYECDVARAASDTDAPATDTTGWSPKASSEGGITQAVQDAIDSQAAINFGAAYKKVWTAGAFAVDDVVYHDGQFYVCTTARSASNTNNPATDTASWSIKTVDVSNVDISGVSADVLNAIHAQATASYGENYQGTWSAGTYSVGNVVYHSGAFYTCDTARSSSNTSNPAADTGSWTIKVAVVGGLSQAVQDAIDAQAKISFGENYKGKWEAGSYAVGDVVSHSGSFFVCDTARSSANTSNPAADTANWSVKESIEGGVTRAINNTIEALGAATFGDDYTGEWEAGAHAVGDVVSYNIRFYECNTARTAANTNNPSVDTSAWHLVGSAVTIRANLQDNIDALGAATYGEKYTGLWEAGVHAVDDYVSYGGRFYRCKVVRTSSNSSDPSADNAGWEAVGSSFTLQGDITTAKQENIDAAARIVFGDDYKGKWAVGVFAVGDVSYDEVTEKFYECDAARTAANTTRPSVNTTAWSLLDALKVNVANSLGLSNLKSQEFTSSGTWTRPTNVSFVKVLLIGGGGGGGGAGSGSGRDGAGGGGGGELIFREAGVTGNVSVTIGAGGLGGAAGIPGATNNGLIGE